ncbi:hypothetical protein BKA56DRAFT_49377 [Ilyonectria sp. MPI-CAGE-AT-0026]|nr:hypothetical protein BKA56DRAFT_49377 [Ilyonectria sp. MPI-CAGE-AT-0026]
MMVSVDDVSALQGQHEVTAFPNRGIGCPGLRGDYPDLHPMAGRCRQEHTHGERNGGVVLHSAAYRGHPQHTAAAKKPPSHSMRQPVTSLPADPAKRSLPPSRFPISECSIAPIHHSSRVPPLQDPPRGLDGQSSSAALGSTASRTTSCLVLAHGREPRNPSALHAKLHPSQSLRQGGA